MAGLASGIDVGRSQARALRGRVEGSRFVVTGFACAPNPTGEIAAGWSALAPDFKLSNSRVGLTGREVNVRYTRVPRVPDWQLRKLMRFEAAEVGEQSESEVASDFNVLPEIPEIDGEDIVLLAMARETLLEEHLHGLEGLAGKLDAFTPNAIALYNAFLRYGVVLEDTVLVANIGATNTDVIVARGADLLFARNLSGGGELFDEALVERFQISPERAADYKQNEATLVADGFRDANQEKAHKAMLAPAGQLLSLLQSTVVFCKAQVKVSTLALDRVLLCGGGARLDGLCAYLSAGLDVPVEVFDPFVVVDSSKLAPQESAALEAHRLESVVALGLATAASDPEAYSIEILPERVQRRRDVLERGAFLVATAVLAVLFLGYYAWTQRARTVALGRDAALLESRLRSAERHDDETRGLLEENAELAQQVAELHALAASGEQLVRALVAIESHLPEGFWLEGLSSDFGHDDGLGVPRQDERPILRVNGRAREGTEATTMLFQEFVAAVRASLPGVAIEERMGDTASFFTLDLSVYGRSPSGSLAASVDTDPTKKNGG